MHLATFGAGCFWGVQAAFNDIDGVIETTVGYMGGRIINPTYEQVCSDKTDHIEVVQIKFNPKIISYEKLLEVFWSIHDPTQRNRQGPDVGSQYQSVIFYYSDMQKKIAEKSIEKMQNTSSKPIVTDLKKAERFYPAEKYHQQYIKKQSFSGFHE
jgi:peptide-methionine (S)-S-oxide reductase